ncbi:cytidine deaminase [Anaerolineae bacterium CFX9]|jgi:cytidine deaminase|nr:cytidine deaminase [Kamptonema cortianum]MDL1899280.1 cytidine deaminase [Anaerolineae bacterium CFX9]
MTSLASHHEEALFDIARQAMENAYVPYSMYRVGAALRAADGRVFSGCNIENAAYPATICAERVALFKAVSEGVRGFDTIVVMTVDGGSPCGHCRQALFEFAPDLRVIITDSNGSVGFEGSLRDLLPMGFGPTNLGKPQP